MKQNSVQNSRFFKLLHIVISLILLVIDLMVKLLSCTSVYASEMHLGS